MQGLAAFLPPLTLPELAWRTGVAGSAVTEEEKKQFEQQGFKQQSGMPTRHYLQLINVALGHIGKTLATFRAPALPPMAQGGVRYWSPSAHRWMRSGSLVLAERQQPRAGPHEAA